MKYKLLGMLLVIGCLHQTANADVGMGLRLGTFGYSADLGVGITERFTVRLAYNALSLHSTINDSDVRYDANYKIDTLSGLVDWHVFRGSFRVTAGLIESGPAFIIKAKPTSTNYEIGNGSYTAAEVGSLQGRIELGDSVLPYIGIGFGNIVSEKHRVTFLADIGVVVGTKIKTTLTAQCGTGVSPSRCSQLQNDVNTETSELNAEVTEVSTYPVLNIGIGIRF